MTADQNADCIRIATLCRAIVCEQLLDCHVAPSVVSRKANDAEGMIRQLCEEAFQGAS